MNLQDYDFINLNEYTVIEKKNLFKFISQPSIPLEHKDLSWVKVTIEMDLNRIEMQRSRYTYLDLLAAFGGFMGIFRWIFGTFMAAWNYQALDNFMVSQLYQTRLSKKKAFNQMEALERSRCPHLGGYILSWVPSCF